MSTDLFPEESPPADAVSFETALAELEKIVRALEAGDASLEDSIAQYERGVGLLKQCHQRLSQAETRILEVSGVDEHGNAITKPFEHVASIEAGGKPSRRTVKKNEGA